MLEQNVFPGGPWSHLNIKRPSYEYGNADHKDKTVPLSFHHYNLNFYTGKTAS